MPTIPTLPPYPSRGSAPDQFSLQADAFVAAMPNWGVQVQAVGDQAAADAATATAAMSSAVAAANYKGIYSAGTTYQIGECVSYGSSRWYAKTVNTGVTPVDGANWGLVNEVPSAVGNDGKSLRAVGGVPVWAGIVDVQEFTSSGTWTKPAGCTTVVVELLGAGGGGGSGYLAAAGSNRAGGGGGGGGCRLPPVVFRAADLGATETITIGSGGTGAAGRTGSVGAGSNGGDGGNTTFGSLLTAYGGKGGAAGTDTSTVARGHGASTVPQTLAPPLVTDAQPNAFGGIGGMCSTTSITGCAEWGGAAGGAAHGQRNGSGEGGGSMYGGAGGGGGDGLNTSNTSTTRGGKGGVCGAYSASLGGAQGTTGTTPTAGSAGAAPTGANFAGQGGGGGGAGTTGSGAAGGAGGRGSGGGGGGAGTGTANTSGSGGDGGAGYCRVTAW